MKGQIKAVLFDMDGVLVEAKDWHYEAFNKALEVFGMPISRSEHLSQYDGLPTRAKLAMLTEKKHLPVHAGHHHHQVPPCFLRRIRALAAPP